MKIKINWKSIAALCTLMIFASMGWALAEDEVLELPSNLRIIRAQAFEGIEEADKIILPEGVERIESRAFALCDAEEFVLPRSLRSIADDAFEGCDTDLHFTVVRNSYAHLWCLNHRFTVTAVGSLDAPSKFGLGRYWTDELQQGAESIFSAMKNAGSNCSAFLWYTDSHWNYNFEMSPRIMKYLYANTPINKTNFGGDIVAFESLDIDEMAYLWQWRRAISGLENHHSIVGNHDDGNGDPIPDGDMPEDFLYSFLLEPELTPDVVRGDKFYYYIDNPEEKTRYIYLDTATRYHNFLEDPAQQTFLKNTLISTPDGWHIVVLSHIWRDVDYSQKPPSDHGFSMAAEMVLAMLDDYNARKGDYARCGGWVEFCIGGHTHVDGNFVSKGGIPIVITECDSTLVRSGMSYIFGTVTENAVSAIVADYDANVLHIIRIGRGYGRRVGLNSALRSKE